MDLALQAALLGAVMGTAILAVSTIYGFTLPAAPKAYGWWAGGFVLSTASMATLLGGSSPMLLQLSDLLHGSSAVLMMFGTASLMGHRGGPASMVMGLVAAVAWAMFAKALRDLLGLMPVPLFGLGSLPLALAGWLFITQGASGRSDGHRAAAGAFLAAAVHQLAAPILHVHSTPATWSLVMAQLLAMSMAVALLMVVVRRQQAVAKSEGERADMMQARLVDALGSVQDGVALYDQADRLVTCNGAYRDFMRPVADFIKPGCQFQDVIKALAERGAIPEAKGREGDWVFDLLAEHANSMSVREQQMWDGRWLAISIYATADGGHLRILRDVTTRKQAELALEESVAWLRGIMDTVIDGIVTIDETGMVLSFNAAASRIFGFAAEEVVGRNVSMLMPEPFRSEHDGYLRNYLDRGEARVVGIGRQTTGMRKDGSTFPMELAVTEMRQGDLLTFIGVVRDITDRKRVEDALVESEQRFRDLAESASDWFWEVDQDMMFTYVSSRVRHVLNVGPDFFTGRFLEELARGPGNADWPRQAERMRAHKPFRGFVFSPALPTGEVKWVEMAGRPAFDLDGTFRGYRGTATDITQLTSHARELEAQSDLRQGIIDNLGQGVAVFDGEERLVALNREARVLLDLGEEEMVPGDAKFADFLACLSEKGEFGGGDAVEAVNRRVAAMRRRPSRIFEHLRPGGRVLEIRSNAMPGGGWIQTYTDITERKKVEGAMRDAKEAAERGNRAKATFLANISHELRTPLNAIIGFSELMKHEIFGPMEPPSYRTYVDDIHESGMHLLELINDILDMSKAEAGMTDLVETVVDVSAVLRSSVRMMMKRASSCRIELREDIPTDLPPLLADERRVRQIVLNLLSNAVKFTDDGGRVVVSARTDEGEGFVIAVADTGIGMTAEDLARVMEPFVQADTRLSRKYEGTGLGLPLTKALVLAHGGKLELDSTPGQGTTVRALFPATRIIKDLEASLAAEEAVRRG